MSVHSQAAVGAWRVTFWVALAMAVTAGVGTLFGAVAQQPGHPSVGERTDRRSAPAHAGPTQPPETTMQPDQQLQDDVIAALEANPEVPSARIGVAVRQGVVGLSGEVRTREEKAVVEQLVQAVPGVKALAVQLSVNIPGHDGGSDFEIARCVALGLRHGPGAALHALKVVVERGIVTLAGEVDTAEQRQTALESLRYLRGVQGVVDRIEIKPTVTESAVRSGVEIALHRLATAEAARISVSVDGDEVTLSGSVQSWDEGRKVIRSVEATRGVRHVVDKLVIAE